MPQTFPNRFLRINRIRLEFKVVFIINWPIELPVLIESDWNLKHYTRIIPYKTMLCINRIRLEFKGFTGQRRERSSLTVLIESDWNLKHDRRKRSPDCPRVLIESDWNLKTLATGHIWKALMY